MAANTPDGLLQPFCRDCLEVAEQHDRRCRACGSPRLFDHPERAHLAIAHVDCDAFFATIEKRDDPALRHRPVIMGGGRRGVVATACYLARRHGVRSAMPMFKALAACPEAVVIRPNLEKYRAVARAVRERMMALTPLVQSVSIDEAYLDLAGTERLHGEDAARVLARLARSLERELGITVSIGLAPNKLLAKIAANLDKPRGLTAIGRAEAAAFLADKPVGLLPGVGGVTVRRLEARGYARLGDLQRAEPEAVLRALGPEGLRLQALARGEDDRPVETERETKSISAETTFEEDIADPARLEPILFALAERVARRARRAELAGRTVTLKLKTPDFRQRTRAQALPEPTQLPRRLYAAARQLLAAEPKGQAYRLIGLGLSQLGPAAEADRGDLVDASAPREARAERAMDLLRARFGDEALTRAAALPALRPRADKR